MSLTGRGGVSLAVRDVVRMRRTMLLMNLPVVLLTGCTMPFLDAGNANDQRRCTRIDVSRYVGKNETTYRRLIFSTDSRYLCLDCDVDPNYSGGDRGGRLVVFNLAGDVIPDATDTEGKTLNTPFSRLFPDLGGMTSWAGFFQNARCWGFDETSGYAIRVLDPAKDAKVVRVWRIEARRMNPDMKQLWQMDVPAMSGPLPPMVSFCDYQNRRCGVIGFFGYEMWVVALDDGRVVKVVNCKRDETTGELMAYRDRFHLQDVDLGDPFLRFWPETAAFEAENGLLAIGERYGRRIRVFSVGAADAAFKELNADATPRSRGWGMWTVDYLSFVAARYLVAGYSSENMEGIIRHSAEVYHIGSWEKVWKTGGSGVAFVCLSPDATLMAKLQNSVVEIIPFAGHPGRVSTFDK